MRKLATIRKIGDIQPIPDADKIEVAVVDGWTVVVKKGQFSVGEKVVFCEIDSWIPTKIAPFLTRPEHFPRVFNEVEGERLRTVKLRGQLSQGLILPFDTLYEDYNTTTGISTLIEGDDVTEWLGIQKYEAPIPAQLAGVCRGNFPPEVPKTDEERIQNLKKYIEDWAFAGIEFEVTEKLEGTSATFYLDLDGSFHVCSRNMDLKETEGNTYWKMARKYHIEERMRTMNSFGIAVQGEIIGEGIQKNYYGIQGQEFFVFKIYNVKTGKYLDSDDRKYICDNLWLKHVPVIKERWMIPYNINQILKFAEGQSVLNPLKKREGLVFNNDQTSFKAINNEYLLKEK